MVFASEVVGAHVATKRSKMMHFFVMFGLMPLTILASVLHLAFIEHVRLLDLTLFTWIYAVWLFVVLCDLLRWKTARFLTIHRGEKWTKELNYVYLALAALGLLGGPTERVFASFSSYLLGLEFRFLAI